MFPNDLRHAARSLAQSPTFTLVAVASLAVGIGANTALFSFLHGMVLAPLPYPDSERVVQVQESVAGRDLAGSPQRVKDWARETEVFEAVGAWYGESLTLSGGERAERVDAWRTLGDLPRVYALRTRAGRGFTATEADGREPAVLLTPAFWRRRFGSDPSIIGRNLVLNGRSYTMVGVLERGLIPGEPDVVIPEPNQNLPRSARFLRQVGRLRQGVTLELAGQRLDLVAADLVRRYPAEDRDLAVRLIPLRDVIGTRARGTLIALLGAVGFVLLSACLNIGSLLLQRARRRSGELAVRLALGAGRGRLARLLLTEGALLAGLGGAFGVVLAAWGIGVLKGIAPADLPRLVEVELNWPTLAFAAGATLLTALTASLAPAWRGTREAPQRILRAASPRSGGLENRAGRIFVVAQIAISLALLFGASLLLRTFTELLERPLGFVDEELMSFELPVSWEMPDVEIQRFQAAVLDTLRALPGISAAEITDRLPLEGETQSGDLVIAGRAADSLPPAARLGQRQVSAGLLELLAVPLVEGRFLNAADATSGGRIALLNRSAARLYFRDQSPLGARVGLSFGGHEPEMFEVVGVIGDLPNAVNETVTQPAMYTLIERGFWPIASFVVRTGLPLAAAQEAVRSALARTFPDRVLEDFRTLPAVVASSVAEPRLTAGLVAGFAVAALLLAAAGLYGLLSNAIAERTFEIGVRVAVGARREDIERLIFSSALPLLAGGLAAGAAGCWVMQRLVANLLYGVTPLDPTAGAGAIGLLAVTAAFAIAVPARRAARTDPAVVLRGG